MNIDTGNIKTQIWMIQNVIRKYGNLNNALYSNATAKHIYENLSDEEKQYLQEYSDKHQWKTGDK